MASGARWVRGVQDPNCVVDGGAARVVANELVPATAEEASAQAKESKVMVMSFQNDGERKRLNPTKPPIRPKMKTFSRANFVRQDGGWRMGDGGWGMVWHRL